MTKVKICGITNIEDAKLVAELGAWAIGFIFYAKSPRFLEIEKAKEISSEVKNLGVKVIGVFVNESAESVNKIARIVGLDYIQMHGTESSAECEKIELPFIKNIRNIDEVGDYPKAFAFLVDAQDTNVWGGTGKLADWNFAQKLKNLDIPLILAGGLSVDNIEQTLIEVAPEYVDISSCLEISPGVKNHKLVKEFFDKINNKENMTNE